MTLEMIKKTKVLLKSDFVQNAGKLASGTILAQVIVFATLPILSRLYSQEAFGLLSVFAAIVGFISSFATLKYDTALVLPKEDKDAYALLKLSNIATIFITVFCIAFMFLPVTYFEKYQDLQILIGLGVLLSINYNNSALWNIRYKHFNHTAIAGVLQAVAIFLFQFLLYYSYELKGLILGNIAGVSIAGFYLLYTRHFNWDYYKKITKQDMLKQGKRYIDYPKYFTASNAILSFTSSLPVLLFVNYIPLAQIGVYGLALRLINQPVALLANSIRSVILADMAKRRNLNRPILKWYSNVFLGLLILSLISSIAVIFLGDYIVPFLLGEEWARAATYAKMLTPLLIGMMIASPGTAAIRVFEMQKYNFKYSIVSLMVKVVTLIGLFNYLTLTFEWVILIYSIISLILIIGNNIIIWVKIKSYDKHITAL